MHGVEVVSPAENAPVSFDYGYTFRVMTLRRLKRGLGGSITPPRSSRLLGVLGFVLFAFGVMSVSINASGAASSNATDAAAGLEFTFRFGVEENVLLLLIAALAVFTALRVVETVRLNVYWLTCGLLAQGSRDMADEMKASASVRIPLSGACD